MQFLTFAALLFAVSTSAIPTADGYGVSGYDPCPAGGAYGNPECCSFDLGGLADGDCSSPVSTPTSAEEFQAICAASGQRARCCVASEVIGQSLICEKPVGVTE